MALLSTLQTHISALRVCPFHQTVATLIILPSLYLYFRPRPPPPKLYLSPRPSPTKHTPKLVSTPYGTIQTTELGPISGPKILLIHGITTPSVVFTPLAESLAASGYRVLTFDLYGRGGSDAPVGVEFDERLYTTQAVYAMWAAEGDWSTFTVAGYSLGGGIAVAAAETFGDRMTSLILFAPAGILHRNATGLLLRLGRDGWVPKAFQTWIAKQRRVKRMEVKAEKAEGKEEHDPIVLIQKAAEWQSEHHPGFFPAFIGSFMKAPIYERQEEWTRVGEMVEKREGGLRVGVLMGERDDVIEVGLLGEMVGLLGGEGRVRGEVLEGAGHDLVSERAEECAEFLRRVVEGRE